ncbi:MAG: hypothetical protein ACOX15_10270 [Tepidanaerobacteraceae bacterium]|jgi:hypothetical protein
MKMLSITESDMQLLKAIKPFMSTKSQGLLDLMITVLNIFNPDQPDEKINFEALTNLLTMVHDSFEAQKLSATVQPLEVNQENSKAKDVENLLKALPENQIGSSDK